MTDPKVEQAEREIATRIDGIREYVSKMTPGPLGYSGYCLIDGAIHVGTIGPKGSTGIDFSQETSCLKLVIDVACRNENDEEAKADAIGYAKLRTDAEWLIEQLVRERSSLLALNRVLIDALPQLRYIEKMGCPCGARGESLNTHPHVGSCGIDKLKELALVALKIGALEAK